MRYDLYGTIDCFCISTIDQCYRFMELINYHIRSCYSRDMKYCNMELNIKSWPLMVLGNKNAKWSWFSWHMSTEYNVLNLSNTKAWPLDHKTPMTSVRMIPQIWFPVCCCWCSTFKHPPVLLVVDACLLVLLLLYCWLLEMLKLEICFLLDSTLKILIRNHCLEPSCVG